jgi:4-amino-4-deoxy-L-arabinose transferase-like glycosyltransferase
MKISRVSPALKQDIIHISILLAIALCIGIYLIDTTALIAKDGVTFIQYAKNFEDSPAKTMLREYQHPGYPFMILATHRIVTTAYSGPSLWSWIYSAQIAALTFRLFSIVVLYFIGKGTLGPKPSFWSVLILIFLPRPAEYGSDALSDWPNLFFLLAGFLLLIKGRITTRWWLFGLTGIVAGAGYLVRPECAQVVVLGCLWLGLQLLCPSHPANRSKVVLALALLLAGFMVVADPYMKLKGAIFPKKNVGQFAQSVQQAAEPDKDSNVPEAADASQFTLTNIAKALFKLWKNAGETLMWFFIPVLLIGMHKWLRSQKWNQPECFLTIGLIALNVPVLVWLYCRHGYMSDRHTLLLLILPILYISLGLQELAVFAHKVFSGQAVPQIIRDRGSRFWFFVLLFIGVALCIPRLARPTRVEKAAYRTASQWLSRYTGPGDLIAVPDLRISYYAGREGVLISDRGIPEEVDYIVELSSAAGAGEAFAGSRYKKEFEYIHRGRKPIHFAVYKDLK